MAVNLTLPIGQTTYVQDIENNFTSVKTATEALQAVVTAQQGQNSVLPQKIFDRDGVIFKNSYLGSFGGSWVYIQAGSAVRQGLLVTSGGQASLNCAGLAAGTLYVYIDQTGSPVLGTSQQSYSIYSVTWNGSSITAITDLRTFLFSGADFAACLNSTVYGTFGLTSLSDVLDVKAPRGYLSVNLSSADVTLTNPQLHNHHFYLTGAISVARYLNIPYGYKGFFLVENATSGSFDVTVRVNGYTGTKVVQGKRALLYSDGIYVRPATDDAGAAGMAPEGVLNQTIYSGTYTLTDAQYMNNIIVLSGSLSANVTIQIPNKARQFLVVNNATQGAWTITVKTATGTGVNVPPSDVVGLYCDGTNVDYAENSIEMLLVKSVAGGVNVTLTAAENKYSFYEFTGAITANIAVIISNAPKLFTAENNTTGNFTLTVKTAAGTGVVVPPGRVMTLYCNGTNVEETDSNRVPEGLLNKTGLTGGTVTLTTDEFRNNIFVLSGTLTSALTLVVPNTVRQFLVVNNSAGNFSVTVKTSAGTGVVAPQGDTISMYCDGTNVDYAENSADLLLSKSVAGGVDVTLTAAENRMKFYEFAGALTANINIIASNTPRLFTAENNTTGGYNITLKTSAGTGVTIPPGRTALLYCNGTNVEDADSIKVKQPSQTIAYAAAITPDMAAGERVIVGTLTGNVTVNNPINAVIGQILTISFGQDAVGSWAITWGAAFKKAADGTGLASQKAAAQFQYDGTHWIQHGGALSWY